MQTHTVIGAETLAGGGQAARARRMAFLQMAVDIARHHHERYDGTGYPDRLAGSDIPLAARLVAICDVYDALRSRRLYKPAPVAHGRAAGDDRGLRQPVRPRPAPGVPPLRQPPRRRLPRPARLNPSRMGPQPTPPLAGPRHAVGAGAPAAGTRRGRYRPPRRPGRTAHAAACFRAKASSARCSQRARGPGQASGGVARAKSRLTGARPTAASTLARAVSINRRQASWAGSYPSAASPATQTTRSAISHSASSFASPPRIASRGPTQRNRASLSRPKMAPTPVPARSRTSRVASNPGPPVSTQTQGRALSIQPNRRSSCPGWAMTSTALPGGSVSCSAMPGPPACRDVRLSRIRRVDIAAAAAAVNGGPSTESLFPQGGLGVGVPALAGFGASNPAKAGTPTRAATPNDPSATEAETWKGSRRPCTILHDRLTFGASSCSATMPWRSGTPPSTPPGARDLVPTPSSPPHDPCATPSPAPHRVLVCGGGKAGAAMAGRRGRPGRPILDRVEGLVNVPAARAPPLRRIACTAPAPPAATTRPPRASPAPSRCWPCRPAPGRTTWPCACSPAAARPCCRRPPTGVTLADKQR